MMRSILGHGAYLSKREKQGRAPRRERGANRRVRWVVGVVEEERDAIERAILLEVLAEEAGGLHIDTHGSKDDREVVFVAIVHVFCRAFDEACLSTDLSGNLEGWRILEFHRIKSLGNKRAHFVMRQAGSRKYRNLLSTGNGIHDVNG